MSAKNGLLEAVYLEKTKIANRYNRSNGNVGVTVKPETDRVVLSVADTGIGIPPEHQDRIFERFYRVDKSHSKELGGTDFGLPIVKHVTRLHSAKLN